MREAVTQTLIAHELPARGGGRLWGKAAVVLGWWLGSYALLVWAPIGVPVAVALALSMSFAQAGVGMSVKHDAVHHAFSRNHRVNAAVVHVATAYGLSAGWWRHKHNRFHHAYTNIDGLDIDLGAVGRLSPQQVWRPRHRWQHVYLWVLYPFVVLSQFFGADLKYALFGRVGSHQVERPSVGRAVVRLADKLKGFVLLVGIALTFRPALGVLAVFLCIYLVGGMVLALTFVVEHTVDTSTFPVIDPPSGQASIGWAESQVRGSANLATQNRLLSWYVGSLNHHIEHHLFPKVGHVHLRTIAPEVRRVCAEHGVPYHEFPTIRAALASHGRFLRALGRAPEHLAP